MKTLDYNAIQKDIHNNLNELNEGDLDVYDFIGTLSKKYIKPVDPKWLDREDDNPFLDVLFGMLEINGVEIN
jgi:hypothetical protein